MKKNYLLRVSLKPLIPFIMIFGLYVQFHGDFGPGGGFQAGVIFAASIILYTLIYGLRDATRVFTARRLEILVASGVLLYGSVGLASMAMGGNFLDYDVLLSADETPSADEAHETAGDARHAAPIHGVGQDIAADHSAVGDPGETGGHHAPPGQHLGILLVELGVGFTVTAVFVGLFFLFAGRSGVRRGRLGSRPAGSELT